MRKRYVKSRFLLISFTPPASDYQHLFSIETLSSCFDALSATLPLRLSATLPFGLSASAGFADAQDPPRQTDDPNHDRYLQTPHFRLRRSHYRSNRPNSLVGILRNYLRGDLRDLDPRFSRLHLVRFFRFMLFWKSRRSHLFRDIRLLLGIPSYRQCRLDHSVGRCIWRMVLFRTEKSSWWCTQRSYPQGVY